MLLRRDGTDGDDIIIYDSAVTEPTRVPQVLLWVDSEQPDVRRGRRQERSDEHRGRTKPPH